MSVPRVEKLVEHLRKSGLLSPSVLQLALEQFENAPSASREPGDAKALLHFLVAEAKLLTTWQAQQLQNGRYKGFFLKDYKLLGLIGSGGMAKIYLAEHSLMGRQVAIKVLPRDRLVRSSCLERFRREAQAIAALDHPHIVRVYDIDAQGDTHYIVMEYLDGRDLQRLVEDEGPLRLATGVDAIRQAAEGLEHAHTRGLIHRDVKPANLFMTSDGLVKVLDLGLALAETPERASLTIAHNDGVLGSADYLAPEQAIDSHAVDARADIYGLGCTLYYVLTGQPPFAGGTLAKRILMHQKSPPPPLADLRPDAPADLCMICSRMLAKRPDDRHASAQAVADVLAEWLSRHGHARPEISLAGARSDTSTEATPADAYPRRSHGRAGRMTSDRCESTAPDGDDHDGDDQPLPRAVDLDDAFSVDAFLAEIDEPLAEWSPRPSRPIGSAPRARGYSGGSAAHGATVASWAAQWPALLMGALVALILLAQLATLFF